MKIVNLGAIVAVGFFGMNCKTTGASKPGISAVRADGAGDVDAVAGLDIADNTPVVTQLADDVQVTSDWEFSCGREYWLYSTRGKYMTFDADGFYAPYKNGAACEGKTTDPNSACSVKPDNLAKACQRIASRTLKAIMDNEPAEYKELKQTYGGGSFSLFGWMNDAHSDKANATNPWQGPFIWRGDQDSVVIGQACPTDFKAVSGYIKWVSSVSKTGLCKTPSKGQLMALLAKAKECLQKNNQN